MNGKVVLITGATAGIGEVAALELARMGAVVVGVGRDAARSAAARERIQQETGSPVEFLLADLSSQSQVRQLAAEFKSKHSRLDVLINNAGAFYSTRQKSVDGIELTWALNHLSYFLLTNLLLDLLLASAPARIVNVASEAHRGNRIDFSQKDGHSRFGYSAYGRSKLANILFTYELARRLDGSGATSNALHPGFVASHFGHNNRDVVGFGTKLIQKIAGRSPQEGARTIVYLATSSEVEGVSGKYFYNEKAVASSPESYDKETAIRLWELSEAMTGLSFQG